MKLIDKPLSAIDEDALKRCLVAARAESKSRAQQIDDMLADPSRSWLQVAVFAATCAQSRSLNLAPWQSPPFRASLNDLDHPPGDVSGRYESAALLQRLLAAGLSRFEPDPIAALARVEAKQRRASQ